MKNIYIVLTAMLLLVGCGEAELAEETCYRATKAFASEMNHSNTNDIGRNASFDAIVAARKWKEKACPTETK